MLYKVNRRILINLKAYNPGSEVELTDKQAAQMRNGQVTLIKAAPVPEVKVSEPKAEEVKAEPEGTGTEEKAAPVE